ncbi:amidase family protein [Sphingosinicella sp.]|uniref:amidase family protein n=1 Tax=Sphingosinicella sp. TaxID=1917971 RepID=UPI0035B00078
MENAPHPQVLENNTPDFSCSRRESITALTLAAAAPGLLTGCGATPDLPNNEIIKLGARDAVDHIRKGDLSAETYVSVLLRQAEAHKALNAFITLIPERVLEAANAVDRSRKRGDVPGRAAGLPFAVKDQIAVAGYPATGGNGALKGYVPDRSASVVHALEGAGAIVFGKTNMPDMVAGFTLDVGAASVNPWFGAPRNPYDMKRMTGGTSGGNGSALGARIVPAAIGEDTTGSIRFPAALCGVSGLRPSTWTIENALGENRPKRYPDDGIVIPPAGLQDTFGPMARTVSDLAFLDSIVTGETAPSVDLRRARIAVPAEAYWSEAFVDPGVARSMQAALALLRDAGATLVEIDFEAVRTLYDDRMMAALPFAAADIEAWLAEHLPKISEAYVLSRREGLYAFPDLPVLDAHERRNVLTRARRRFLDLFVTHGVTAILSPTVTIPAPELRTDGEKEGQSIVIAGKTFSQVWTLCRNIFWGPALGATGITIPSGLADGLPVGLQLEAPSGSDLHLLGLGMAIERLLGPIDPPAYVDG